MILLKKGCKTPSRTKQLQERLIALGYLKEGEADGVYGSITENAVIAFQTATNLLADGVAGERTLNALGLGENKTFLPDPKALTQEDIVIAASRLKISIPFLMAIATVESSGYGFNTDGSLKLLYERHIFWREAKADGLDLLAKAVKQADDTVCSNISGGYLGGIRENARLEKAKRYHRDIAFRSASYGRFQLMGFNHKKCGYDSAEAMFDAANEGENNQLTMLTKFIMSDKELHNAAKKEDYLNFALIYNGPKQQGYDLKLKEATENYRQG